MTIVAKHKYAGKTVAEILKQKRGDIKQAPLDPGSPTWDELGGLTWEEIVSRAKKRVPGYQTIKKLLSKGEYDK